MLIIGFIIISIPSVLFGMMFGSVNPSLITLNLVFQVSSLVLVVVGVLALIGRVEIARRMKEIRQIRRCSCWAPHHSLEAKFCWNCGEPLSE